MHTNNVHGVVICLAFSYSYFVRRRIRSTFFFFGSEMIEEKKVSISSIRIIIQIDFILFQEDDDINVLIYLCCCIYKHSPSLQQHAINTQHTTMLNIQKSYRTYLILRPHIYRDSSGRKLNSAREKFQKIKRMVDQTFTHPNSNRAPLFRIVPR
jgi:hypothetical protein